MRWWYSYHQHHTTTILWPFFRDHPSEMVTEENFWTLWCKGRLTEADIPTIHLGTTLSGLTSAHLHHPPILFTGRMPFLPPNQQCQSTEGKMIIFLTLLVRINNVRGNSAHTLALVKMKLECKRRPVVHSSLLNSVEHKAVKLMH